MGILRYEDIVVESPRGGLSEPDFAIHPNFNFASKGRAFRAAFFLQAVGYA